MGLFNMSKIQDNDRKNKIRGSLIGGAIGDALGYQIEFKRNIKEREITKFLNTPAIISDDTQMTLFTANGLIWRETRGALKGIAPMPPDAVYRAYLDWLDTQYNENKHNSISWIKNVEALNHQRAPGNTCIGALSSGIKGTIDKPINDSKGCGGIMRVAPVGLYMNNSEIAGKFGADVGAITHGHPLGIIPCYVFSTLIYFLLNEKISIKDALNKALKQYEEKFDIFDKEYKQYFLQLTKKAIELSEKNISDIEAIKEIGEGWVAEETFAIAIYACLKYSNDFENAIICSINHDGDSDSTGSVAGNIIGASLGYSNIPSYYKDNIELKDIILELSDDLSVHVPVSEYSTNDDKKWIEKYLYCRK